MWCERFLEKNRKVSEGGMRFTVIGAVLRRLSATNVGYNVFETLFARYGSLQVGVCTKKALNWLHLLTVLCEKTPIRQIDIRFAKLFQLPFKLLKCWKTFDAGGWIFLNCTLKSTLKAKLEKADEVIKKRDAHGSYLLKTCSTVTLPKLLKVSIRKSFLSHSGPWKKKRERRDF